MGFLPDDRQQARPRALDLTGLALLSPALVFFLYGIDRLGQRMGGALMCGGLLLFALYGAWAHRKGDDALIDLRPVARPGWLADDADGAGYDVHLIR